MDVQAPKRPWWKKKRWAAALLLWLILLYPLSLGPAHYAMARQWVPPAVVRIYAPLSLPAPTEDSLGYQIVRYTAWWRMLGYRHAEAASH